MYGGGKKLRLFDASWFSLEWLCLNADKLVIRILKLKINIQFARCKIQFACCRAPQKAPADSLLYTHAPNTHVRVVYVWSSTKWLQWLAMAIRLALTSWKLLYGSILSSMKSTGKLTRPTQLVRYVELNLSTLAAQFIWENTLRYATQSWERSSDLLQMPAREQSSRWWYSFNRTLREQSGLPNHETVDFRWWCSLMNLLIFLMIITKVGSD